MDKANFINFLFDKFKVNDSEFEYKFSAYNKGINSFKNYESLLNQINEMNYTNLPTINDINELLNNLKIVSFSCEALEHCDYLRKTACCEPLNNIFTPEMKLKIELLYRKTGKIKKWI